MKLYRKKLDSLEALKREKIRLRYERRQTRVSDLNPLAEVGQSKVSLSSREGILGTILDLFSAQSNLQMAWAVAKPIMKGVRKSRERKAGSYAASRRHKKSFLRKLVAEVATGYAIGKAVQMAVRGTQMLLRRRKIAKLQARLKS